MIYIGSLVDYLAQVIYAKNCPATFYCIFELIWAPMTTKQNISVCFWSFYKTLFSWGPLDKENLNEFDGGTLMKKVFYRSSRNTPWYFAAIKSGWTVFLLISLGLNSLPGSCDKQNLLLKKDNTYSSHPCCWGVSTVHFNSIFIWSPFLKPFLSVDFVGENGHPSDNSNTDQKGQKGGKGVVVILFVDHSSPSRWGLRLVVGFGHSYLW